MKNEWIDGKGYRKKCLFDAHDFDQKGALLQIVEIPPQSSVPKHFHKSSLEAFQIIEGEGYMTINGEEFYLEKGDALLCEPDESHSARNPFKTPFRILVFKTGAKPNDSFWD